MTKPIIVVEMPRKQSSNGIFNKKLYHFFALPYSYVASYQSFWLLI